MSKKRKAEALSFVQDALLDGTVLQIVEESKGEEKQWEPDSRPDNMGFILLPGDKMDQFPIKRVRQDLLENLDELEILRSVLSSLPDRDRAVLDLRFGLTSREPMTLRQASLIIGVSVERIRQLEALALYKLREPIRLDILMREIPYNWN